MAKQTSAVFSANLREFNFNYQHNSLLLGLQMRDKIKIFPNIQEDFFVLGLTRNADAFLVSASEPCLCAGVVTLPLDSEPQADTETTKTSNFSLLCSKSFLQHYGFHDKEEITVKRLIPPHLSKVTFEAKTERAFKWASSHFFTTGLLVNICNQYGVLARRNDAFLTPHSKLFDNDPDFTSDILSELLVIDTEPFLQGTITIKTKFIVLNAYEKTNANVEQSRSTNRHTTKPLHPVYVSDFAVPNTSLFVPRHINKPIFNTKRCENATFQRDWNFFSCDHLSKLPNFRGKSSLDLDHLLYVTLNTAKKYNIFNGSIIEIQKHDQPNSASHTDRRKDPCEGRIHNKSSDLTLRVVEARIYPVTTDDDLQHLNCSDTVEESLDDKIFLSAALWYNMNRGYDVPNMQDVLIKFRKHHLLQPDCSSVSVTSTSSGIPKAAEVRVMCVSSPNYSSGAIHNTALKVFFSTPRLLAPGDIFAVDTSVDPEYSQSSESCTSPLVYFKVKKILPKLSPRHQTYYVHTQCSALYQDGSCHSPIPSVLSHTFPGLRPPGSVIPPGLETNVQELVQVIHPYLSKWTTATECQPSMLLHGPAGSGKGRLTQAVASKLNIHHYKVNCYDLCGDTSSATEARIQQTVQKVCLHSPCILLLENIHAIGKDRDGNSEDPRVSSYFHQCLNQTTHKESADWPIIVIATTATPKQLSADMHSGFLHTFEVEVPDEPKRLMMLSRLLDDVPHSASVSARKTAQRTAGFVLGDLEMLVCQAKKMAYRRIHQTCFPAGSRPTLDEELSLTLCGPLLLQTDLDQALDHIQSTHSDAIGAPKIPSVTWDDVGGLTQVKADILDTIQLPLQHPELFAAGLRRSGVLLFGPPGTGKTLLAKAVATECSLNFLSVKGPELINMYVGQSEENVREVFSRARNASPCVIFFDELDSLAPNRGRSGDSGGVMDRVVSQLLAELDGLHKACDVFVIGATNRPDLLDSALLRPGRFDKLLYLGVSEDRESQLKILKALTRKFTLSPSCRLEEIVHRCPRNLTGADFYAVCSDAMLNALKRSIDILEAGGEVCDDRVEVQKEDFLQALDTLVPSVSEVELQHYKTLQAVLAHSK